MPKPTSSQDAGLQHGWRSGLEDALGAYLTAKGIPYKYEQVVVPFTQPVQPRKYTPDFLLKNGIILETKGRFVTADRKKHKLVKEQWPDLDIRFVFSNPNQRISKQSKTTYAQWCLTHGFKYAKAEKGNMVPMAWLLEPVNVKSLACAKSLLKE